MASHQRLLDLLTSHISLYHSQTPTHDPNPNPNPRTAVLRWFSSLSVHHRRAHLTIVDANFLAILLQMREKLASCGAGRFIILPDLPQNRDSALPTLCYRKSEGLLSRFSEFNCADRAIRESLELFGSMEGEGGDGRVGGILGVDAACVAEGLVEDVGGFVEVMDKITNGEFLRGGEEGEMAAEWVELGWLKAKGYYNLEEFVANRLEVALRLAWLNCNGGKKRGVKLKEKLALAGVGANLFWRKKGCVDWWENLDGSVKKKVYCTYLAKAARSLTADMVKGNSLHLDDKVWGCDGQDKQLQICESSILGRRDIAASKGMGSKIRRKAIPALNSGNESSLDCIFSSLYILQVVCTLFSAAQLDCDNEGLFFSSLDSVNSISDIIFRKLREFLMVISLDCTKFELLGEGGTNPVKTSVHVKHAASNCKKKSKNRKKKSNSAPRSCPDNSKCTMPTKGKGDGTLSNEDIRQSNKLDLQVPNKDIAYGNLLSADAVEPVKGVNGKLRAASRKSRKERKKLKSSICNTEIDSCQSRCTRNCSASTSSQDGPSVSDCSSTLTFENLSKNVMTHVDGYSGNPCLSNDSFSTESVGKHVENGYIETGDTDGHLFLNNHMHLDRTLSDGAETTGGGPLKFDCESSVLKIEPLVENKDCVKEIGCGRHVSGNSAEQMKGGEVKAESSLVQEQGSLRVLRVGTINSPAYLSYEWPNLAPIHPSPNHPHLPHATDRLHLDVGYNLQSHFHHSFLRTLQVRNASAENAYSGILSTPLPMSFDWPPAVHGVNRLVPSVTCNYDSEFISRRQSSFQQGRAQSKQSGAAISEDEWTISGEPMDLHDITSSQEQMDEHDKHWMSEEELEAHALSGKDYNQYFGGGVMYWNTSDHPGTSFSRPPSLCSDDSSWAWREADMNRAVDDMVAFSSSYSTNGLTSPSTASFCSPFDPLAPGTLGYVMPGSEISSKVLHSSSAMTDLGAEESASGSMSNISCDGEVKTGDSLPCPILRPIIIPHMSRERSKRGYDHKSPCVPPSRREHPRIKRPPSPVVLCVPSAPRPPPPSPVGDSRKHRGFPTVRSGSSSPRHWGVKGWFHDGLSFEDACIPLDGNEVVWPSWRNKSLSARQLTQPLPGTLLQDRLIAISQLARDQEHPDVTFPLQPPDSQNCTKHNASLSVMHDILHDEIGSFCNQVSAENLIRKPYINWAVKRVARSLQVLWPRSRTNIYGSNATGLSLPSSDVDLVVSLPPVRNLEPIKEAGILEGRNGIKETCLQHAARYLANQEWVKSDSLKIVENTAIPIIMLVVEVPHDLISSLPKDQTPKEETDQVVAEEYAASSECTTFPNRSKTRNTTNDGFKTVRLDISFKSPTHTGLQTTGLVKDLTERFPAVTPLALVLKQFLADRSLDQSYSGGLSSYCLILFITRFLQHEHHHGRPINQNYGSLLMDFLYFFGNVFDPRQMRISVQGSGVYINRERGCSIDPLCIDDPLFLTNNVGRNCFRIHQCIKAFADAYTMLENELTCFNNDDGSDTKATRKLLPMLIPSIGHLVGS